MTKRPYEILLVENNLGDVMLIEECLHAAGIPFQLTHCDTVKSAVETMSGYCAGDGKIPDLLLLDYNLPTGEAREVLEAALANPALAPTRKAVITSSTSERDHENALQSGAECVIGKPSELDLFIAEVGRAIARLLRDAATTKTAERAADGAHTRH